MAEALLGRRPARWPAPRCSPTRSGCSSARTRRPSCSRAEARAAGRRARRPGAWRPTGRRRYAAARACDRRQLPGAAPAGPRRRGDPAHLGPGARGRSSTSSGAWSTSRAPRSSTCSRERGHGRSRRCRGARPSVTFVERTPPALAAIRANLASLGLGRAARPTVVRADAAGLARPGARHFDLALVRPALRVRRLGRRCSAASTAALAVLESGRAVEVPAGWEVIEAQAVRRYARHRGPPRPTCRAEARKASP